MKVVINEAALNHALASSPQVDAALRNTAETIMAAARGFSPVGRDLVAPKSAPQRQGRRRGRRKFRMFGGYFKRRWSVQRYRTWYRVRNDDPFAHLVEFGSRNNRAYAPLRNAIRSMRLRFVESPKGTRS